MNKVTEAYSDIRKGSSGCCDANKSSMIVKKALLATDGQKEKMVLEGCNTPKVEKDEKDEKVVQPKKEVKEKPITASAPRRHRVAHFVENYLQ